MEVDGISKEQMSFSKKTPELLTFPDRLIGYITGPDVKKFNLKKKVTRKVQFLG